MLFIILDRTLADEADDTANELRQHTSRRPHYASLPQSYPEIPMEWPDAALDALLPPARAAKVRAQRAERDEVRALLQTNAPAEYARAQRAWARHHRWADPVTWAYATVRSRAFKISVEGVARAALVPVADMANHAPGLGVNAEWEYDGSRGGFRVQTVRPVAAGS